MQRLIQSIRLYCCMELEWNKQVDRCKRGDQLAQMAFYRHYAQVLYPVCYRLLANQQEAEEAMQDSFVKIFASLNAYQEERQLVGWMCQITRNTAIDYLRRKPFEWEDLDESITLVSEEEQDDNIIQCGIERIKRAITTLPSGYRAVLTLHLFEGYDLEEIASILSIKPASARSQYQRAKKKLIQILNHRKQ